MLANIDLYVMPTLLNKDRQYIVSYFPYDVVNFKFDLYWCLDTVEYG